ncbi:MAG: chromosome segregation protein SMC [Tissierellia bacterium]|nr:chromosome segregation protein SMC [Tissierellia bacterium]
MRLKKLEIQGFKSFADKTTIEIIDGITAIVGPNGSGKSNIADAIRWVLGEQSVKNLRGNKMEDVIFAGTSKRKALGYSEVTITFDNKEGVIPLDYSEVEITRRMFRSGESEYYINKNSCRLKDIREIFMDTGVGKDGYSIIGQGRIDEILSNKPEDRRNIFEEAAGIVKYKTKKEEAEKKLEKTQGNLLRIKDIIFELTNRLDNLEVEANKASIFTELYNKLKKLEINIFLKNIREIDSQIKKILEEKGELENKLAERVKEKLEIESKFNILKEQIEELDKSIENSRNNNLNISKELENNQNQLKIIEEKEKYFNRDLERLVEEKSLLEKKLKEYEGSILEIQKEIIKTKEEHEKILNEFKNKSIELESSQNKLKEMEKDIDEEKNNMIRLYNNSSDKKSELNSIISFNENVEKRIAQLKKEIQLMDGRKKDNLDKHNDYTKNELEISAELSNLKEKLNKFRDEEIKRNYSLNSINEMINNENIKLQSKLSSLKILKNMENDYEGYFKGVKSVLQLSKENPSLNKGLIGIVADLIKVDEKFEKAIEISLGSNIQNVVTKTEQDAKKIIEYLRDNKLGRITCLPLNVIKGNIIQLNPKDKQEFKIYGLGYELIEFKKEFDNIFKFLLGRTIIIENMDYGIKFANKYNHSYRIVTLLGEVLNPGGSITGGSFGDSGISIISRRSKIERLSKEVEEIKNIQTKLAKDKTTLTEKLVNLRKEILNIEEMIKEKEYKLIEVRNLKENNNLEIERLDKSIEKSIGEIETLNAEVKDYNERINKLSDLINDYEKEIQINKEKIANLTSSFNKEKLDIEEKSKVVTDLKISLSSIENKIMSLYENEKKKNIEIEDSLIGLKEKEEAIITNSQNIESIKRERADLIKTIQELEASVKESKTELDNLIIDKDKIMKSFYNEQNRLIELNELISNMEKSINQQEVKLAKSSVQLENYHKKLYDDYDLTYEEALEYEIDIENMKNALVETRRLKGEIKELGNVNLGAIEEYKNVKSRLEFILKQQNDLIDAKESLNQVIKDMENTMRSQFLMNFNEINKNFQEIFKILFNGGHAELILEEKENILEAGIEINAQPPGKKLQSLSLLSGGEKSLTAVALLFAILKLKPSPFCILDEIDAALDEANINRYTSYLKKFQKDTQFVIITHRKTTMEIADVLYGVAMEEEGISKIISVKLKDNMDEIAS